MEGGGGGTTTLSVLVWASTCSRALLCTGSMVSIDPCVFYQGLPGPWSPVVSMGSLLSALCFALHGWLDDGVASDGLAGTCGAMDVRSTDRWTVLLAS